jgi:hypothetical protein
MRRTLIFWVGLILIGGVLLLGRDYLDTHPLMLGGIIAVIVAANAFLW